MSMEQELKLVVLDSAPIALESISFLKNKNIVDIKTVTLVSTYFDTPDKHLQTMGVGLRMRRYDQQWMQTVKTSGRVKNGLHQRDEWEHDLSEDQWDMAHLKSTPLAVLIEKNEVWSTLRPLFTTDFERQVITLRCDDGSEIELAYDRGHVLAGSLKDDIHEIELELKSGSVGVLSELADKLCALLPLAPSDVSKAKQGYTLAAKANG